MDNTPPVPFDGLSSNEEPKPHGLTLAKLNATIDEFAQEQFESDKKLIEALYAAGLRVLVGGNRPNLPVAILPASFAKAHEAVLEEARIKKGQARPSFWNPFENGNIMS